MGLVQLQRTLPSNNPYPSLGFSVYNSCADRTGDLGNTLKENCEFVAVALRIHRGNAQPPRWRITMNFSFTQ
jgi:hypothetical protein